MPGARNGYPPRFIYPPSPHNPPYNSDPSSVRPTRYDQQRGVAELNDHKLHQIHRQATAISSTDDLATRTPSPTPSEAEALSRAGAFNWKRLKDWRFWIRGEWTWYYIIAISIATAIALITFFHNKIVDFLMPAAHWMHSLPFGWLIPVAVLFILSFPPLFGHEIVAVLCGLVWGLWVGFAIVSLGTFLGELGNFYAFKWCCRARGEKLERTNLSYACLAQVVRAGGFKVALVARLSAIPGHFTTAVFSTCGMGIIIFSIAAVLSLPKQLITVYLGVVLEQSAGGTPVNSKDNIIKWTVIGTTTLITIWAVWYIYHAMGRVKVQVIYERRKARQVKQSSLHNDHVPSRSIDLNVPHSNSQVDSHNSMIRGQFDQHTNFTSDASSEPYQRWDEHGNAVGWTGDPNSVFAPRPRRAAGHVVPLLETTEENVGYRYPPIETKQSARAVLPRAEPVRWETESDPGGPSRGAEVNQSPSQTDQYRLSANSFILSEAQSSESQYSYIPSMQLTQSDPLPSRSPAMTPTFDFPTSMVTSVSLSGLEPRPQYQYDSSESYYSSMYDSASPQLIPAVSYLQASPRQPSEALHFSGQASVDDRRGYLLPPPSYHTVR